MSEKKRIAILYSLAALFLIVFGIITYHLDPILNHGAGELGSVINYSRSGELRYNVIPFANYARLVQAGYSMEALELWFLQVALYIPFGLLFPLMNVWSRSYKRVLLIWLSLSLLFEGTSLITRVGVFNIDNVLFLFLGISVGYWLWKRICSKGRGV